MRREVAFQETAKRETSAVSGGDGRGRFAPHSGTRLSLRRKAGLRQGTTGFAFGGCWRVTNISREYAQSAGQHPLSQKGHSQKRHVCFLFNIHRPLSCTGV